MGIAQTLALAPGVSRSGCTIAAGLLCGFSREWAPRFAFLLSIPVILGGTLLTLAKVMWGQASDAFDPLVYGIAVLIAAVIGYGSIVLVIDSVRRGNLLYFSIYCALVGTLAIMAAPFAP